MQNLSLKKLISKVIGLGSVCSIMALSSFSYADEKLESTVVSLPQISTELALKLAEKSVLQCKQDGYDVTTTVVDNAGQVLVQLRSNYAGIHSLESSRKKAFTAVSMKRSTDTLMNMIADKPQLQPLKDMDDNLLLLAGGIPLTQSKLNQDKETQDKGMKGKQIIGGIGVSGAPGGHLDIICAQAAIDAYL